MPIHAYRGVEPQLGKRVFLAPSAVVVGDVIVGDDVSFWFHTAARGDVHWIRIGDRTNIQDGAVLHVTDDHFPLSIGSEVVVGHGAIVHGCTIHDGVLIGIGSKVLDGAVVEEGAQIAAGALVAPGQTIPKGHLAMGIPARVTRPLTEEQQVEIREISRRYVRVKDQYLEKFETSPRRAESKP
jgi:carbonic anhydrase/acetyltransferase-like protein (isoleucine patch superfamily)